MENKKRYILSLIVAILVVISLGTYAWLTYRTNDTAMVLTIGDINNVRITMNPYQIDASLSPNLTYTGQPYTTVEVVNNSLEPKGIKLYYKVNAIDSELATSNLKYTIEKKAVGSSSYTHITPDGNFAGATKGDIITVVDEEAPVGTTYYKVYVWLYSASSAQNNVTGKRFNAELGADIANYVYTVNIEDQENPERTVVVIGRQINSNIIKYQTLSSAMNDFERPVAFKHKIGTFSGYCMYEKENGVENSSYYCLDSSQLACETRAQDWAWEEDGVTYTYECRYLEVDNTITESYVVFTVTPEMASANPGMTAGTYTLKGGDQGISYSTNVSTLTTAFGIANCTEQSHSFYCGTFDLETLVSEYGSVSVGRKNDFERWHCLLEVDGHSVCDR